MFYVSCFWESLTLGVSPPKSMSPGLPRGTTVLSWNVMWDSWRVECHVRFFRSFEICFLFLTSPNAKGQDFFSTEANVQCIPTMHRVLQRMLQRMFQHKPAPAPNILFSRMHIYINDQEYFFFFNVWYKSSLKLTFNTNHIRCWTEWEKRKGFRV